MTPEKSEAGFGAARRGGGGGGYADSRGSSAGQLKVGGGNGGMSWCAQAPVPTSEMTAVKGEVPRLSNDQHEQGQG